MQNRFLALDNQRMSCVMPTLEANNGSRLLGQQVNNFALALIAPLRAEHNYITTH